MILLWGTRDDAPLMAVLDWLRREGLPVVFVDQLRALETEIDMTIGADLCGELRLGQETFDLREITGMYLRPDDARVLSLSAAPGRESAYWRHSVLLEDCLLSFADLTPALVLNRPAAMASNNSKPYQALLIRSHGFDIPDTLITTDPDAARAFWRKHDSVIYKSISGVRSIVARLAPQDAARLPDVAWCPTQFQELIPGPDYRVHVVGGQCFACEVISDADDYRYGARSGHGVTIRNYALPDDCARQCRDLAAALGLTVAGIDLRRSGDGRWYCFEVNPSPGFTYYAGAAGQPVAAAIGALLAGAVPAQTSEKPSHRAATS